MELEQILEQYGLSPRQAKVYIAALELGEASVMEIAQKANIERTGTYYVIESLRNHGLLSKTKKGKKDLYMAVEPEVLFEVEKKRKSMLEMHLPELKALYNQSQKKPKVQLFEGPEGIRSIFLRTLKSKKSDELVAFTPFETAHKAGLPVAGKGFEWGYEYIQERAKRGIFVRDIAEDSPEAREHQKRDKEEFRETRLVPKEKFPFTNEIGIFQDWVMVVSYKEMIGLVVESADVANTWKAIFELAWEGAGKYQK